VQRLLRNLTPRIQVAQKRETDEMMGKFKEMGNSILGEVVGQVSGTDLILDTGMFGLSTDNFKFEPNGQGGYSVNMTK